MSFRIAEREIGPKHPPYIVAEMSCNHLGSFERAKDIIHAAREAGADAVKLQTYTPNTMTIDAEGPDFVISGGLWDGRRLYELYQEAMTPWDWHADLFALGRKLGLTVFSSPFDVGAVEFLKSLGAPAYKIASFELVDHSLITACSETGMPVIMSTGMANLEEIAEAVDVARGAGGGSIALLHAISGYPTPAADFNLATITDMKDRFDVVVGISDHTLGIAVPVAATAIGACVIEKHLTLSRREGGPDAAFSLEPLEFAEMVRSCRDGWEAIGNVSYQRAMSEKPNALLRRSLYAIKDIAAGEAFTPDNIRSIRPALGLAPKYLPHILKGRAARAIKRGEPLDWSAVAKV
jgi:N-acetylneuraminate synthase